MGLKMKNFPLFDINKSPFRAGSLELMSEQYQYTVEFMKSAKWCIYIYEIVLPFL